MRFLFNNNIFFVGSRISASSATVATAQTVAKTASKNPPIPKMSSYTSGTHSVAFVTTPDEKTAKSLAQSIVEKKLAACVNIIPQITSIYTWEDKLNEDNEVLMMIKTKSSRIDELAKFVRENHPYSVAEVISLPIENGNIPYLDWITKTVPDKKVD